MSYKAATPRAGQTFLYTGLHPVLDRAELVVSGVENLPKNEFVIGPHHETIGGIFADLAAVRQERPETLFAIAIKKGLRYIPGLVPIGCVPVERVSSNGQSREARKAYVTGFAGRLAERVVSYPDARGVGAIFPEGTRHSQLTEVRKGVVLLASSMADLLDREVEVVTAGQANDSFPKIFSHLPRGVEDYGQRLSVAFGEAVGVPPGLTERYMKFGGEVLIPFQRDIERSMAGATTVARAEVGLEPLEFIGRVELRKHR